MRRFLVVVSLVTAASQTEAGFLSDPIDAQQLYPTQDHVRIDLGTRAVDPVANFHDEDSVMALEVRDSTISITSIFEGLITFEQADFNGFSFTDTSGRANIIGVSIDPASRMLGAFHDPSRYSFTSNSVFVNLEDLGFGSKGQSLILDVQFGPQSVPEPGTLGLLIVGLAGWGATRALKGDRRRAAACPRRTHPLRLMQGS